MEEKIGLTVEDLGDVTMTFGLFDQYDDGTVDLESMEAAFFQMNEGSITDTFFGPLRRLKRQGKTA
jgi:hypothetical protein